MGCEWVWVFSGSGFSVGSGCEWVWTVGGFRLYDQDLCVRAMSGSGHEWDYSVCGSGSETSLWVAPSCECPWAMSGHGLRVGSPWAWVMSEHGEDVCGREWALSGHGL